MTALYYAYAVIDASEAGPLAAAGLTGIDGGLVTLVADGDMAAAVSAVNPAEFDSAALNRLAPNLEWLGPRAAAHQRVNAELFQRCAATLPLAFGAVYRDLAGVQAMLSRDGIRLRRGLAAARGRGEWVVAVHRDREAAVAALEAGSAALQELRAAIMASAPGRAYLLARQVDGLRRRELLTQDAAASAALDGIAPLAVATFDEPLPEGGQQDTLRRVSFLVERATESAWLAALAALQEHWMARGYPIRGTGPWPAYRFSTLDRTANDG